MEYMKENPQYGDSFSRKGLTLIESDCFDPWHSEEVLSSRLSPEGGYLTSLQGMHRATGSSKNRKHRALEHFQIQFLKFEIGSYYVIQGGLQLVMFLLHPPRWWNFCNALSCYSHYRHKLCAVCHRVQDVSSFPSQLPSAFLISSDTCVGSFLPAQKQTSTYTSFKRQRLWVAWNPSRKTNNKGQTQFKTFSGFDPRIQWNRKLC